jgi:uncharacterized protein
MKFEVMRASGGQYFWRIVDSTGQVLATSELYYTKANAVQALESVRALAASAAIADRTT